MNWRLHTTHFFQLYTKLSHACVALNESKKYNWSINKLKRGHLKFFKLQTSFYVKTCEQTNQSWSDFTVGNSVPVNLQTSSVLSPTSSYLQTQRSLPFCWCQGSPSWNPRRGLRGQHGNSPPWVSPFIASKRGASKTPAATGLRKQHELVTGSGGELE